MLTARHKATILRKAGFDVPATPSDPESTTAFGSWIQSVETLYVSYAAARAAKSLRDAEETRQLDMLRRLALQTHA